MTQEEIEYNKRCIKIIGGKHLVNDQYELPTMKTFPPKGNSNLCHTAKVCCLEDMQFHCDWNWIHEVINAIEKLEYESTKVLDEFRIESFQVVVRAWITPEHKIYNIISCEPSTKKEAVVQAINQFLIWYNENKIPTVV